MANEQTGPDANSAILLNAAQILEAVNGAELLFTPLSAAARQGFVLAATDSRNVTPGSLFVPLVGTMQDGHRYIAEASDAGASVVFVEKSRARENAAQLKALYKKNGTLFFAVDHTLYAFQEAAAFYAAQFPSLCKIGVTGSSGKTTVKEMLAAIFSVRGETVKNEGNLNSETGLPLSVFNIRARHRFGVFEMGMNRRNEIRELAGILRPSLALITNIGTAHVGILGSRREIAEEKKNIFFYFDGSCTGFVPASDDFASLLADIPAGKIVFYGSRQKKLAVDPDGASGISETEDFGLSGFRIRYENEDIFLRLPGFYNLRNAVGALAVARFAGFSPAEIKAGLESVSNLPGRTEILKIGGKQRPLTVIKDCYNANPDSMQHALEFAAGLQPEGRLVLVLGSMLELGSVSREAHKDAVERALLSGADALFLFGDDMHQAWERVPFDAKSEAASRNLRVFLPETVEVLGDELDAFLQRGDLVLLKGSRAMALERVLPLLGGGEFFVPEDAHA